MNLRRVSLAVLFLCSLITFTICSNNPTDSTGDVSINCGSTGTSAARNGREWIGDVQPEFSSLLKINGLSSTTSSSVIHKLTSADQVPHKTARVSTSQFSYAFQVINPGQKIIRLHFYPSTYKGFKGMKDLFTVEAGNFTLLSNFSASLTAAALGVNTFTKEFCLDLQENPQEFNVVFSSQSLDTYAFINGIEIISVPASLSYFQGGDIGLHVVGQKSLVYVDDNTALEIIHRLNFQQHFASSADYSGDMFGMWLTAPKLEVNDISWKVSVDVGFRYLVRLHFSEIGFKMAESRGMSFKVLINEMVAITNTDTIEEKDDSTIPWYRDYMVMMNGRKQEGNRNLMVCLQSNEEFINGHAPPLKGFEILKLSNTDSSLASPNPRPLTQDSPSQTIQTLFSVIGHRSTITTVAITIITLINIIVHKVREIWEASSSEEENKPSARAQRFCRCFSLVEIRLATKNFSDGLLIGKGGFGKVYKGIIDNGKKTVAIKRLKSNSNQGAHEFLTEIETLSELRHVNLVSLIGYCSERREMILVYEYMSCGALSDHLYKLEKHSSNFTPLNWKQRISICIGAGRGLDYLHTGHGVIHRDVKASNILLDEDFVPKVSDFGLAKPQGGSQQSHVSTKVKGTRGYLDPYYVSNRKLTRKSDTYAFGVVLLEVLCGRPAVDQGVLEDEKVLTKWALDNIRKGEVDKIVALSLRGEISVNSLKTFLGVAERCLHDEPKYRPTMTQVVLQLEFALEQQESNKKLALNGIASVFYDIHPSTSKDKIDATSTKQSTVASLADMQKLTFPPNKQIKSKVVNTELTSGRTHERRSIAIKLSKLWPQSTCWSRVGPSKKNELSSSGLPHYGLGEIRAATNNFCNHSKLGQGAFGFVYKGKFSNDQKIAVKRLSTGSMQGNTEFKNEVLLLAKLQHQNLVRLLGFSVEGTERLLIYEFVENASLDCFIFDPSKRSYLDWDRRHKIIRGTAEGLLFLHYDSRFTIIHRDLKASNVLLDEDWNPKISDFGLARLMEQNETGGETRRIVGTYGYMAPEYAMNGYFSVKSDVFSFGVLVLEMMSGQRNSSFRNGENTENLLSSTWKNWRKGTTENVIDPILRTGTDNIQDMLRIIHIGLLCVQENADSRPTTSSIVLMLSTSTVTLPMPSEPAFLMGSGNNLEDSTFKNDSTDPNSSKASKAKEAPPKRSSQNDISVTELSPR